MKNSTNSTSAYLLALCSVVLLLEAGCNILDPQSSVTFNPMEGLPTSITSRYDLSNIVGVITPSEEACQIITQVFPASDRTNWTGTQNLCQANFADANGNPLNIGTVIFNTQLDLNTAAPTTGDYFIDTLPIYTDGVTENHVQILPYSGNSSYGSASDSLLYSVVPTITNITFNQNLSRDSTITVNWTGTSSDYVSVSIYTWDSTGANDTKGHALSVGSYYNNTGSATLLSNNQLIKGLADVEVRIFTPKFITLSNGKRVAVMLQTCEEITVHIVD
jgi:hypothetical protein